MPKSDHWLDEEEATRIRMRFKKALNAGMSNADASVYANEPSSFPTCAQAALASAPAIIVGCGTVQWGSGESDESVAAPLSPKPPRSGSSEDTGRHENTDAERLADDSDRDVSQALPAQNSDALSECDSPSGANDEGSSQPTVPAQSSKRLQNGKWRPGVSGNPKGRKPKNPSNDLDVPSELEQALDKKVTLKHGEKKRTVTMRTAVLEQWVNQAGKGDHRARRDLIAYAAKHGIDLFAGQHKAIQEGMAEAARSSSAFTLSEEVLDRLSPGTLNELIKVAKELEAEKKKKMH